MLTVTDELQRSQLFTYNAACRLVTSVNGRGDSEIYGYNGNGWITSVQNGRGYTRTQLTGHYRRGAAAFP